MTTYTLPVPILVQMVGQHTPLPPLVAGDVHRVLAGKHIVLDGVTVFPDGTATIIAEATEAAVVAALATMTTADVDRDAKEYALAEAELQAALADITKKQPNSRTPAERGLVAVARQQGRFPEPTTLPVLPE